MLKLEEIKEDENFKEKLTKKNINVLYKIRYLLLLDNFVWNMSEAESYRRRPFPIKFLQNEASPFPCYVFSSPLSKAFNDYKEIQVIVSLIEFI